MNKQNLIAALQAHFTTVCGDSGLAGIYANEAVHFLLPKFDHLHAELTKAQEEIALRQEHTVEQAKRADKAEAVLQEYRKALVQIEAKGLGATATAGYTCASIAEVALAKQSTTDSRKQDCIAFYKWWSRQPGEDIAQGYDEWKAEQSA